MPRLFFLILFLLNHSYVLASCDCRADYISSIGLEYIATQCPPEGADDNTLYHYRIYLIRCSGKVSKHADYGDNSNTPSSLGNYIKSSGYRVLRNPSGTHMIAVHWNYRGTVAGIGVTGLSAGIYTYESMNNYCLNQGTPPDSDEDGWPSCFDCDDQDPLHVNDCPAIETIKNLGQQVPSGNRSCFRNNPPFS